MVGSIARRRGAVPAKRIPQTPPRRALRNVGGEGVGGPPGGVLGRFGGQGGNSGGRLGTRSPVPGRQVVGVAS